MRSAILLFAAGTMLAAPAAAAPAPHRAAPAAARLSEGQRLAKLFRDSDEASLRRNPLSALSRGDLRYADRFGDYITDAYFAAERQAAESDLATLASIDRARPTPEERISYDVFKWQRQLNLKGLEQPLLKEQTERPIDHFSGLQVAMPDISSGEGAAPFKTVADYENNLKRLAGYIVYLDRAIGRMRQGMADGIVQPKLVMRNVVAQLDGLIAGRVEDSTFYKPVTKFPASRPPTRRGSRPNMRPSSATG